MVTKLLRLFGTPSKNIIQAKSYLIVINSATKLCIKSLITVTRLCMVQIIRLTNQKAAKNADF